MAYTPGWMNTQCMFGFLVAINHKVPMMVIGVEHNHSLTGSSL